MTTQQTFSCEDSCILRVRDFIMLLPVRIVSSSTNFTIHSESLSSLIYTVGYNWRMKKCSNHAWSWSARQITVCSR